MALQICGLNLDNKSRELCPHGTLSFPCAGYEEILAGNIDNVVPWHWHEEFELVHIDEGTLHLKIPGQNFILRAGETAFVNSGILHYAEALPECRIQSLVFSPALVTGAASSAFSLKYVDPMMQCKKLSAINLSAAADATTDFLTAFLALKEEPFGFEFTVREGLSRIVLRICSEYKTLFNQSVPAQSDTDSQRIEQMLTFIEKHFPEKLTLSQIASSVSIGERECLRCFKRTIDESPMQYLMNYRLKAGAEYLLSRPDDDISEIAFLCGFDSPSYFSKQFKKYYLTTPKKYRNAKLNR